jgi:diacylglycerol kinase family enzyme
VLRHYLAMLTGRLPRASGVAIEVARTVTITGEDGAPVQADGDIAARLPVTLAIAERAIPLVRG